MRESRFSRYYYRGGVLALLAVVPALLTEMAYARDDAKASQVLTVRLIIDYDDGVQKHFTRIPWTRGMTVLDAMNIAKASPHGITFVYTGTGRNAFLTKIDDLENQGGGSEKKNWLYWVNTKFGNKGFGVFELQPSDVVLWKFQRYKEDS